MDIRIGTTPIKSAANVIAQIELPFAYKLVVFRVHGGDGMIAYIFPPFTGGTVTQNIMEAAEIALEAFA
jgi:hypothetical protein